jgi:hypothetical protein
MGLKFWINLSNFTTYVSLQKIFQWNQLSSMYFVLAEQSNIFKNNSQVLVDYPIVTENLIIKVLWHINKKLLQKLLFVKGTRSSRVISGSRTRCSRWPPSRTTTSGPRRRTSWTSWETWASSEQSIMVVFFYQGCWVGLLLFWDHSKCVCPSTAWLVSARWDYYHQ